MLHSLLQVNEPAIVSADKGKQRAVGERPSEGDNIKPSGPKAIYEVVQNGEHLQPRLRVWVGTTNASEDSHEDSDKQISPSSDSRIAIFLNKPESAPSSPVVNDSTDDVFEPPKEDLLLISRPLTTVPGKSLVWTLQRRQSVSLVTDTDGEDTWSAETEGFSDLAETLGPPAHPVELVNREYVSRLSDVDDPLTLLQGFVYLRTERVNS